jgi:hypothetical protein
LGKPLTRGIKDGMMKRCSHNYSYFNLKISLKAACFEENIPREDESGLSGVFRQVNPVF